MKIELSKIELGILKLACEHILDDINDSVMGDFSPKDIKLLEYTYNELCKRDQT